MQRRKFIATTAAAIPTLAFGQNLAEQESRTDNGFVVKAGSMNLLLFLAVPALTTSKCPTKTLQAN
jgi:hypothetical protein